MQSFSPVIICSLKKESFKTVSLVVNLMSVELTQLMWQHKISRNFCINSIILGWAADTTFGATVSGNDILIRGCKSAQGVRNTDSLDQNCSEGADNTKGKLAEWTDFHP